MDTEARQAIEWALKLGDHIADDNFDRALVAAKWAAFSAAKFVEQTTGERALAADIADRIEAALARRAVAA